MKTYKPYLSLSKASEKYELAVIVNAAKNQTITGIRQEEVKSGNDKYWGVIITLSDATQLINGPENPIFSSMIEISLDKSASYKKIMCSTEIPISDGRYGPAAGGNTTVDFGDAGN